MSSSCTSTNPLIQRLQKGFLHLGLKASLFLFSKVVIKMTPLIIRLLWLSLSQLSFMVLSSKIISMNDQKSKVSELNAKQVLEGIIQPRTTTLHLRSLHRNVVIICLTYFVALGVLENILIQCLEVTYEIGKRILRFLLS